MGDETKDERAQEQTGYTMTPTLEEATSSTKANGGEQVPVGKLLQAGLRGTRDDYEYSLHTFYKSPCFRQALLWGIGLGSAIALHRYKESSEVQVSWRSHCQSLHCSCATCQRRQPVPIFPWSAVQGILCGQRMHSWPRGPESRLAAGESWPTDVTRLARAPGHVPASAWQTNTLPESALQQGGARARRIACLETIAAPAQHEPLPASIHQRGSTTTPHHQPHCNAYRPVSQAPTRPLLRRS